METHQKTAIQEATSSRRSFLKSAGIATVATMASGALVGDPWSRFEVPTAEASNSVKAEAERRRRAAYQLRIRAAKSERNVGVPPHPTNGDEELYSNFIGNYSK